MPLVCEIDVASLPSTPSPGLVNDASRLPLFFTVTGMGGLPTMASSLPKASAVPPLHYAGTTRSLDPSWWKPDAGVASPPPASTRGSSASWLPYCLWAAVPRSCRRTLDPRGPPSDEHGWASSTPSPDDERSACSSLRWYIRLLRSVRVEIRCRMMAHGRYLGVFALCNFSTG